MAPLWDDPITRSSGPAMVSLVSMPFKALWDPPIQLGILEHTLLRAGIGARSHSLDLAFMEHLHAATSGDSVNRPLCIDDYHDVACKDFVVQLGDWIFMVPPYAEPSPEDDDFLAYVRSTGVPEEAVATAVRMKALVPQFLMAAAEELLADAPRIVGFSTVFQQNVASLVLAKMLKARDPSLTIVFGGGNCDGAMGSALHKCFPWIDLVVRGEGERVLVEVVRDVLSGRPIRPQPGLCYRAEGQSVVVPQEAKPQLCMDDVPSPIYDEYFERLARSPLRAELLPNVAILFESSRGCWWGAKSHCTFCGTNSARTPFRSKPAERVAEEVLSLARRYEVLNFTAVDDIIGLAHVRELLPLIRAADSDLEIYYETKANLTKDNLLAFYAAGVNQIQPGIESLSTPILRLMRKGITALQNIRFLKWCAEIGISVDWNLLFGFPGEPPEEYKLMAELVPSIIHLKPPKLSPIQIQRFSPYFERPAEFGLQIMGPMPYYRFLYHVPAESLADLAYDFEHRYLDGRVPASYTVELAEAVARWRASSKDGFRSLSYRRGPGFLVVRDRRPGLERANYTFDEMEASIYLACDAGATAEAVCRHLAADGREMPSSHDVEAFLLELVDARLVYHEGSRFLSLAVAERAAPHAGSRRMHSAG
ncbi:MAG: RiPP maturation radical SAM C-methyltransferase [Dehalococcoidia bacterium]|nr:RiPP maturation radical SAM C-methyltransferase [Dehalococcoidia bacterium]